MNIRSIWSEAWANLRTGTSRAAIFALAFVGLIGAVLILDTRAVLDVVTRAEQFRAAGAATRWIRATGTVDGRQCDALGMPQGGSPPITAAGALRTGESLRLLAMPNTTITSWEVTPGVIPLLEQITENQHDGLGGIWVSADLAGNLGVRPGSVVATDQGDARVAGVYDWADDGRVRDLGFTIVVPVAAAGLFDACWANIWPQDESAAALMFLPVQDTEGRSEQGQLNGSLGATLAPTRELAVRLTRHLAYATAGVGLALGWMAIRLRRLEIGSALHARVPKPALIAQLLLESIGWVLPASLISGSVAVLTAAFAIRRAGYPADLLPWLATIGARNLIAAIVGVLLATILAAATCREKHLFALFKNR